ncbi:MAG: ankyrin repeat domain-containing protein [Candidatus Hydrogenedentes bacterium]|nr:ankyrin repeat domain-containing protein [Candidatus Hydrogenedentota bacterium]
MSTPLPNVDEPFRCIANGDRPRLLDLLRNQPELMAKRSENGESPLLYAAYRGHRDLVEVLIEFGAEPDIFEAATLGDVTRVSRILKGDASQARALSGDGWTALHLAAHFDQREAALLLLDRGANVNASSSDTSLAPRNTPLHAACASSRYEMALMLLENGANPDAAQANGMTPLHIAAAGPNPAIVQLLLERNADPNLTDKEGRTPLALAGQLDRPNNAALLRPHTRADDSMR